MDSVKVYCSVLFEPIPNEKLDVVSYFGVQWRTWECAVGEDSDPGTIADWVDGLVCDLDEELNGTSTC